MSARLPAPLLVVALLLLPQTAHADGEEEFAGTVTPVTGDYLDLLTNVLYHYDASTGLLTPTGASAAVLGHAVADLYPRGYQPDALSGDAGACTFDFCVSTLVAVVGAKKVVVVVESEGYLSGCGTNRRVQEFPPLLNPVTYVKFRWSMNHCGHGVASVQLIIDGIPYDFERVAY